VAFLGLLDTEHPACGRNLSGVENIRFQLSYLLDRLTKYWRNLLSGRIDYFVHDARTFIYTRLLRLGWRLFYQVGLRYGWAAPKVTENNELVLAAAWGNYNPPRCL
jgi:hypothetical protein